MAQRKTTSKASAEDAPQSDPAEPIDSKRLLKHLTRLLKVLEQDLLARADGSPGLTEALKARHAVEVEDERTADGYDAWRRGVVTQVAAAWVLNVVFVRVLEDRGLIEHARIAGPGALASERQFLELAPYLTERDYLLTVFRELSHFEVTRELFDPQRNLAYRITPSADAAKQVLAVFRLGSAEAPTFRFGQESTRFLGDLYQDLSEAVRKKYALLQTPDFIESFILDRTLEPALETYGLDATTLIDPTCGSGHFLLGAFERLLDRQQREHPNRNERDAAIAALGAVYGVDINPYAASIAKFRLVLAFLEKAGFTKLAAAPAVPLNVVTADSLYHQVPDEHAGQGDFGYRPGQKTRDWFGVAFAFEEEEKAKAILGRGFSAVVGNPPYITVKDKAQNEAYRRRYRACHRSYSLAAPFAERFFQLCRAAGYTGMITANSFMKREFGKVLIQDVFSTLDLQLLVNTSGAYVPGHGTPTVLVFGRNQAPSRPTVQVVLSKRGEPSTPSDPARGEVWSSIARCVDEVGFENEYISVAELERSRLATHPWSLGGGGAAELKELLEQQASTTLGELVASVGRTTVVGEDDVWIHPPGFLERRDRGAFAIPLVVGECVRDWWIERPPAVLYPYKRLGGEAVEESCPMVQWLWPWRELLGQRTVFGKQMRASGRPWWEHLEHYTSKLRTPLSITFAFVATHNHFVLDRGGKVFNRSAPIIKLPETATEDDHYALLAYLNSSTAAFYFRQCAHSKGAQGVNEGHKAEVWEQFLEYGGKVVESVPVPKRLHSLKGLGERLAAFAEQRHQLQALATDETRGELVLRDGELVAKMCSLQEELDWRVYRLFGLVDDDELRVALRWLASQRLVPGTRPFESLLFCRMQSGHHSAWFARNRYSEPQDLEGPIESAISQNRWLQLLEQPEHKRRWGLWDWDEIVGQRAANEVLGKAEESLRHGDVVQALSQFDDAGLVIDQCAPFLAALRYTTGGLEKHAQWLQTWALQRREDAGEAVGPIPVPPKYKPDDYQRPSYWTLRGKLDVPKERFISYPGCESDDDRSPVYGWAGWNHLQRAQALAGLYQARKDEGWEPTRLLPMLVGLIELLPWLHQYHDEPDEALGGERPADQFEAFVADELRIAGKTREQAEREVLAWAQQRGGEAKKRAKAKSERDDDDALLGADSESDHSAPASSEPPAASLKPPRRAKPGTKSRAANDTDPPPSAEPASSTRLASSRAPDASRTGASRSGKGGGR